MQASTTANVYEVLADNPVAVHPAGLRVVNGAPVHVTGLEGAADVVEEYTIQESNDVFVP
jgi:hypothetical protein